jgi:MFS family permease
MSDATPISSVPDRRWLILGVIGLAQVMVIMSLTVMNIALLSAQRALHFSTADRQWVVTAYTLAFGSLLLLGGRLADLLGRKVTFLTGLAGFAGASAIGGASVNFAMLITARACQGAFAALLVPSALSLLTTTFTEQKDRGRAFAVYGAIAGAGGAIGLLLGGALTEYLSWRCSRPGSAGRPTRCCRPAWCSTATAAARTCRCSSPRSGCSGSSCS